MATDLAEGPTGATVRGAKATFALAGLPRVNGANIVQAGIAAASGAILPPTRP